MCTFSKIQAGQITFLAVLGKTEDQLEHDADGFIIDPDYVALLKSYMAWRVSK